MYVLKIEFDDKKLTPIKLKKPIGYVVKRAKNALAAGAISAEIDDVKGTPIARFSE